MTSIETKLSQSRIVESSPVYIVLLAGESGTGKTAVINMVFDNMQLKTSSCAVGCTVRCDSISGLLKGHPNINLQMVDTVGLCESLEGTVPSEQAMSTLQEKLDRLHSEGGIHLVLFCIRKGRQSNATSRHYQTIVHGLCENQVPCLLVITRCEDDDPLGEWWQENEVYLRTQLKFDVKDAVAVTTIKKDEFLDDYNESRKRLIEAIEKYALKQPWCIKNFRERISSFFKKHIRTPVQPTQSNPYMNHLQRPMTAPAPTKPKRNWFGKLI